MHQPVLEREAQAFVGASTPPYLFQLAPPVGRKALDEAQSPEVEVPVSLSG